MQSTVAEPIIESPSQAQDAPADNQEAIKLRDQKIKDCYESELPKDYMNVVKKEFKQHDFFMHAYAYNYGHYRSLTRSKPVVKTDNITMTRSYLIWNKSRKSKKYQFITNYVKELDIEKFSEYMKIPLKKVAWADLDNTEALSKDFPDMKVEHIGLHNLIEDKNLITVIDE